MAEDGSMPENFNLSSLPDPGNRFTLGEVLGTGVYAEVYEATDNQSGGKRAIKIQSVIPDVEEDLKNEYNILKKFSSHPNLPDFYGVYFKKASSRTEEDKIWFVLELCDGGPITDLVRGLQEKNRRMSEEHIAYILKEVVKVLVYLQENHVMHRDVKGSNILLTREGEVKLVDFGLSRFLKNTLDKRGTYVGSPCWMAPEMITNAFKEEDKSYDSRIDVWALGITAIELGDGKAPFLDIHPTRALFQITRNPPPKLYRPSNWTQMYNDFITECLEKNPEHRPFIVELIEHPFLTSLPENDFHLSKELKQLIEDFINKGQQNRKTEFAVKNGFLKTGLSPKMELMHQEDLAAMEKLNEETIIQELQQRLKQGHFYTFVGDVLLALNPNEDIPIFGKEMHEKYQCKARSDNPPHIYSVADRAYQDVMHHEEPQYILLAGETLSGKTTNMLHLLRHLLFLGQSPNKVGESVEKATKVIHALGNAATPFNPNSTRHVLQLEVTYSSTGKVSGAIFWLYQLEKWRVATSNRGQANFHIFYYFYDAMEAIGRLKQYNLDGGRKYRYLRTQSSQGSSDNTHGPREDPQGNVEKFHELEEQLRYIGFQDDHLDTLCNLISAILILGEIKFKQGPDNEAELETPDTAAKAAQLLSVDEKKFSWSLVHYCIIEKGTAMRRRHTKEEAEEATDVLAAAIYFRVVDWIVNVINHKLSFTRAVFGDKYSITVMDMFGFECYKKNGLEQLLVNTLNEQMQYHYNQRVYVWEMQEQQEEEIPFQTLQYYDNKPTIDELMSKSEGFLYLLDEASKTRQGSKYILRTLENRDKGGRLKVAGDHEFSVAHYTGKVTYDTREMAEKNRDFLPPEMMDTLRLSSDKIVKLLFSNQLSRTGNLTMSATDCGFILDKKKSKWGAPLMADDNKTKKFNPESQGQFSQAHQMRMVATTYRGTSLEILKGLAVGPGCGGTHFVRCMRADLTGQPKGFQEDVVRQQLRALAVIDTAHARQIGYPHRIPFAEFLRRYKFLAFDFDETVDVTKENSRLLLVRLKMEGWMIGKSKVFLKYYNEEYLARTYEIQVKKIVKVQTMMRAFLAKRNVASRLLQFRRRSVDNAADENDKIKRKNSTKLSEEDATVIIQKQYRGYRVRKQIGPLSRRKPNIDTMEFVRDYYRRWKARTIFQVLLMYRSARQQDLVYFSQQVHLYNQTAMGGLTKNNNEGIPLDKVECGARASLVLGKRRPTVWKRPFHFDYDMPYFDTTFLNDPKTSGIRPSTSKENETEAWDAPLRRGNSVPWRITKHMMRDKEVQTSYTPSHEQDEFQQENHIQVPFCRDPNIMASQKNDQKKEIANQNLPQKDKIKESPFLQNVNLKKRTEVYNPGKVKRLEQQRQDFDNRSREWEKNNILEDSIPPYGPRPVSPIPGQSSRISYNYYKQTSQVMEKNKQQNKDHGHKNWGPRSPIKNKPVHNSKNQYNRQDAARIGNINRGLGSHISNNPIAEMELKGRRKIDQDENDEPPFNFQAMLRKTNTTRASLKRAHEKQQGSPTQETYTQQDKNIINDRCDSRSSSIVYNSSIGNRSPTSSTGSKKSWTGNEQWNRPEPKKLWNNNDINDNDEWNKDDSIKSWNDNEQWNKTEIKKSWNDKEELNEPTPWNESIDFCRSPPTELSRSEFVQSWDKKMLHESLDQSPELSNDSTELNAVTTTELVPGLILEGQVADL